MEAAAAPKVFITSVLPYTGTGLVPDQIIYRFLEVDSRLIALSRKRFYIKGFKLAS